MFKRCAKQFGFNTFLQWLNHEIWMRQMSYLASGRPKCPKSIRDLLQTTEQLAKKDQITMYLCLYCAGSNDFDAAEIHYKGHWKGWALKWQGAKRVPFGPKKVETSSDNKFEVLNHVCTRYDADSGWISPADFIPWEWTPTFSKMDTYLQQKWTPTFNKNGQLPSKIEGSHTATTCN